MLNSNFGPVAVNLFGVIISTPGWLRAYRCDYRLIQDDGTMGKQKVITIYKQKVGWK